jgi:hypothetical protein
MLAIGLLDSPLGWNTQSLVDPVRYRMWRYWPGTKAKQAGDATRAAENRGPGFERACKKRRMKIGGTRSLICRASFASAFKLFVGAWTSCD